MTKQHKHSTEHSELHETIDADRAANSTHLHSAERRSVDLWSEGGRGSVVDVIPFKQQMIHSVLSSKISHHETRSEPDSESQFE